MPEATSGSFAQVPASSAFSSLYGRVANYVLMPTDSEVVAICKEAINEAILKLNTKNWSWSRTNEDITLSAGTQEYAFGLYFKAPRSCDLLNNAAVQEVSGSLIYFDPKEFELRFPRRTNQGSPGAYTIYNEFINGKLTLDSAPTTSYVANYPHVRLRYYRRMQTLSGDASTFAGPSEAESFLVWFGRATVASHWDPVKVGFAEKRANDAWLDLIRSDARHDLTDF